MGICPHFRQKPLIKKQKLAKPTQGPSNKIPSRTMVTKRLGFSAGLLVVFTLPYRGLSWFCHSNDLTSSTMGSPWAEEAQERIGANLAASLSKNLTSWQFARYLYRRYASKTGNNFDLNRGLASFRTQPLRKRRNGIIKERRRTDQFRGRTFWTTDLGEGHKDNCALRSQPTQSSGVNMQVHSSNSCNQDVQKASTWCTWQR